MNMLGIWIGGGLLCPTRIRFFIFYRPRVDLLLGWLCLIGFGGTIFLPALRFSFLIVFDRYRPTLKSVNHCPCTRQGIKAKKMERAIRKIPCLELHGIVVSQTIDRPLIFRIEMDTTEPVEGPCAGRSRFRRYEAHTSSGGSYREKMFSESVRSWVVENCHDFRGGCNLHQHTKFDGIFNDAWKGADVIYDSHGVEIARWPFICK